MAWQEAKGIYLGCALSFLAETWEQGNPELRDTSLLPAVQVKWPARLPQWHCLARCVCVQEQHVPRQPQGILIPPLQNWSRDGWHKGTLTQMLLTPRCCRWAIAGHYFLSFWTQWLTRVVHGKSWLFLTCDLNHTVLKATICSLCWMAESPPQQHLSLLDLLKVEEQN